MRNMVLHDQVLLGTVNAGRLIIRRVPVTSWTGALDQHPEDIKAVVDLTA